MENRPPRRKAEEQPAKRPNAAAPVRGSGEGSRTALARLIEQEKVRKGSRPQRDPADAPTDELQPPEP